MKNYADLGGCYPPQPSASADNTLLDLHNSSYHTQPHPIIVKYSCNLDNDLQQDELVAFDVRRTHPNLGQSVVVGFPVVLRGPSSKLFRRSSAFSAPSWITSCVRAHLAFLTTSFVVCAKTTAHRVELYSRPLNLSLPTNTIERFTETEWKGHCRLILKILRARFAIIAWQRHSSNPGPPTHEMICLRICVNTLSMPLTVPEFRLQELQDFLSSWLYKALFSQRDYINTHLVSLLIRFLEGNISVRQ